MLLSFTNTQMTFSSNSLLHQFQREITVQGHFLIHSSGLPDPESCYANTRSSSCSGQCSTPLKEQVCSLGVFLDPQLSLDDQVASVARKLFAQLRLVHQLRSYLNLAVPRSGYSSQCPSSIFFILLRGAPLKNCSEAAVSAECGSLR